MQITIDDIEEVKVKQHPNNSKNEKDKVIMDVLAGEYSPTDTIKNILYKIGSGGYGRISVSFGGSITNLNINSNKQNILQLNPQ